MNSKIDDLGLGVEYQPFRVLLDHPKTGLPLVDEASGEQAYIDVEGYDSDAGEKLRKAAFARAQRQAKGFRESSQTLEAAREENADSLAQLTKGWMLVNLDGQKIDFECNAANARAIYARPATAWMAAQVQAALRVEANFIKA